MDPVTSFHWSVESPGLTPASVLSIEFNFVSHLISMECCEPDLRTLKWLEKPSDTIKFTTFDEAGNKLYCRTFIDLELIDDQQAFDHEQPADGESYLAVRELTLEYEECRTEYYMAPE